MHAHSTQTAHNTSTDIFNILGREDQGLTRFIKESIYIRVHNPTLNRNIGKFNLSHIWDRVLLNIGKFNLSHIWDRVLLNTPGLKLNNNNGQA